MVALAGGFASVVIFSVSPLPRITALSAFILGTALFYAPLAYGSMRPEYLPGLYLLLVAFVVCGRIAVGLEKRRPKYPWLAQVCVSVILIQGWWMTLLPTFVPGTTFNGGIVNATRDDIHAISFQSMLMTTVLLAVFYLLCDLLADVSTRKFVLMSLAMSGVLISIFGIVLKVAGQPLMLHFWRFTDVDWNDFALFRYHGNAGEFLNLAWPLILVFARQAYRPNVPPASRATWTAAALACGLALFMNASKASLVIGLLILPFPFMTWLLRLRATTLLAWSVGAAVMIAVGLFISAQISHESALQRLTETHGVTVSYDDRMAAYQEYIDAIPAVGAFGLGPGLFHLAFPYQSSPLANVGAAIRDYAHEDYLQTVLEWGWFGTIWWTLLVGGGLYRAIRTYREREMFASKGDRRVLLAAILGVCATLAQALMDFPLQIASIRLCFLVLLALCWASPRLLVEAPPVAPKKRKFKLATPTREQLAQYQPQPKS